MSRRSFGKLGELVPGRTSSTSFHAATNPCGEGVELSVLGGGSVARWFFVVILTDLEASYTDPGIFTELDSERRYPLPL